MSCTIWISGGASFTRARSRSLSSGVTLHLLSALVALWLVHASLPIPLDSFRYLGIPMVRTGERHRSLAIREQPHMVAHDSRYHRPSGGSILFRTEDELSFRFAPVGDQLGLGCGLAPVCKQ